MTKLIVEMEMPKRCIECGVRLKCKRYVCGLQQDIAEGLKPLMGNKDCLIKGVLPESEPERFRINGYSMKDLLLFAEMCKRNDVQEADLKQAAWNIELAVRAVMNERKEIIKNMVDEITMRFTPDFKKAYEEMTPNCGAIMTKGEAI